MSSILELTVRRNEVGYRVLTGRAAAPEQGSEGAIPLAAFSEAKQDVIGTLSSLREKHRCRNVRLLLPLSRCVHSIVELPVTSKRDIEGALGFELERALPLPPAEYVSDYGVIRKGKGSSKLLVLSVKRDFLERIDVCVREAGMTLVSVRCALLEALSQVMRQGSARDFLLVHVHGGETAVVVVEQRQCAVMKHISGSVDLPRELRLLMDTHDVRSVLMSGEVTDDVRNAVGPAREVQAGGRSFRIGYPSCRFEFAKDGIGGRRPMVGWGAAIGLGAASLALILAGFFYPIYRDYRILRDLDTQIEELKGKAEGPLERKKQLDDLRQRIKFLDGVRGNRDSSVRVLSELSAALPADVWLLSFAVDEKGFAELRGFAANATELVEILERSRMFKNVSFSAPILTQGDKARFSIKMEIER